jgi:hypothetical protein
MRWLDKFPLPLLAIPAIMLALAPFAPEPHLVEKLRMLAGGHLTRPIDIFDLFMHGAPLALLLVKLGRAAVRRTASA